MESKTQNNLSLFHVCRPVLGSQELEVAIFSTFLRATLYRSGQPVHWERFKSSGGCQSIGGKSMFQK
jgi:hypothetical protein